jgi:hypothetical protein
MLLAECAQGGVDVRVGHTVTDIFRADRFRPRGLHRRASWLLFSCRAIFLAGSSLDAAISPGDLTCTPSELPFDRELKLIWNTECTAYPKTNAAIC